MCLKPQPPRPIPEATTALVAGLFDDGEVYQFIDDVLFDQFYDEDFADLYPNDGQPSISPVLLSFVIIFQSLEDLSDRKTVYGLRFRFDWKYALHLPPDYRAFDHTVLSEFRQRLLKHKAEARVFNAIFAQLKQLGFYKQKGIQRTDSLAIYTHCRLLKRGGGHILSDNWIDYIQAPTVSNWWRAHNTSLEAGATAAKGLFNLEPPAERLFIAGVLRRVYLLGDACARLGQCVPTQYGILKAAIVAGQYPEHYPTAPDDPIVKLTIAEYPADFAIFAELHPEWVAATFARCLTGDLSVPFPYQVPGQEQP